MSFMVPVAEPHTAEELYELYRRVLARRYNPPVRPKKVILALLPPAPPALVHRTRWYEYEESWVRTKAAIHALRNIGGRSHAELIVRLVARETGTPEDLILASDRTFGARSPKVIKARTEAITRLYKATRWSLQKIGRFFRRDHSTILHSLYKTGVRQHAGKIIMSDETLETAARRIIRFVRVDDAAHGGLLSRDTIQAADTLEHQLRQREAKQKRGKALSRDNGQSNSEQAHGRS